MFLCFSSETITQKNINIPIKYVKAKQDNIYFLPKNYEQSDCQGIHLSSDNTVHCFSKKRNNRTKDPSDSRCLTQIPELLDNFENLLQKFFEGNFEFLFDKKYIYFIDVENFCFEIYSQKSLVGKYEIIIGSREINRGKLAVVFQNIRNPSKNLVIRYYKYSKNSLCHERFG